jgi:uncharacterized protein YbjT (DUF2867 family)
MDGPASLATPFDGGAAVFSGQNHHSSGYAGEVRQAKNVADAVLGAGVPHLVYAAAGLRRPTPVGSWETKEEVVAYLRDREVPATVLRPMAFMELMTDKKFFPPVSVWSVMPRLMGADRPVGWLAVEDNAAIVAKVLSEPQRFIGEDITLVADVQSVNQCRTLWREVTGRNPRRMPMPTPLFERFTGRDETTMWRWLADNHFEFPTQSTLDLLPEALTVRAWLELSVRPRPSSPPRPRQS